MTSLSPSIDDSALISAQKALDIFEQFDSLVLDLEGFCRDLTGITKEELLIHITKLKGILTILENSDTLPDITSQLISYNQKSKIERLGIGKNILHARFVQNRTIEEIKQQYEGQVSLSHISRFLGIYEKANARDKAKMFNPVDDSVFSTEKQLEKLLVTINVQLSRLTYANDPKQQEVHKGYVGELRQLLKLASDFKSQMKQDSEQKAFQQNVSKILLTVCTDRQREIVADMLRSFMGASFDGASVESHIVKFSKGVAEARQGAEEQEMRQIQLAESGDLLSGTIKMPPVLRANY